MRVLVLCLMVVLSACANSGAATYDLFLSSDLITPSFRGDGSTTWVGWDVFNDGGSGTEIIDDSTPDIGTDTGSFVTTNGEDHLSGSLNYYSGGGSVSEDITFDTDGVDGSGFTTIIVQAKTLFGPFGSEIAFSSINGVAPTIVNTATTGTTNAVGEGQLFAKYELTGVDGPQTISVSSGPFSFMSIDQVVVDTVWSDAGFAPDSAIITPEPGAVVLSLLGGAIALVVRRRV